ncbi:pancreatic triacylglycerol lipase isoform X2 [Bombina bombina]|uniref:pancreatic triacylglycerol lipase isoform X2 n=1 Tax=Bombina bombina TaxID=8345 RepID=UPI00235A4E12|nr:pancreatic triacylglycerol lipase isoform X2 [Bombina bombina]
MAPRLPPSRVHDGQRDSRCYTSGVLREMLEVVWTFLLLAQIVKGGDVCYPNHGCYTDSPPWGGTQERPISTLPWSPEKINTRFFLYTRENTSIFQEVKISTISASNFNTSRKTHFIIHGYLEKGDYIWMEKMCQTMLQVEDVNCFSVDWSGGSRTLYSQATANIQVVGAEVANFINTLQSNFSHPLSMVNLIGHSLGAHAAGEAGRRNPGIGKISGLDPAGPLFEGTPTEVRLDLTDAVLVQVIHTNAAEFLPYFGLGIKQPIGHLDFYPNGGEFMPGCPKIIINLSLDIDKVFEGLAETAGCHHARSRGYYTDSILHPDGYIGFPSPSYSEFQKGTAFPCPTGGCPVMGHYANNYAGNISNSQTFYLNTGNTESYARWRYKVSVEIVGSASVKGNFNVILFGTNGNTRYEIYNGLIIPGSTYTAFIDAETNLGTVKHVIFGWYSNLINFFSTTLLGAKSVTVQYGKDGTTSTFCGGLTTEKSIQQSIGSC